VNTVDGLDLSFSILWLQFLYYLGLVGPFKFSDCPLKLEYFSDIVAKFVIFHFEKCESLVLNAGRG
jgi:hypothetical protein